MDIRIGKTTYTTGLVWRTLSPGDKRAKRAEILRLAEEQFAGDGRVFFGVVIEAQSEDLGGAVGFYPFPGNTFDKTPKLASLAATLASVVEEGGFLLRLGRDGDSLLYVEIREGIVVPDTDQWVAEDSLPSLADDLPPGFPLFTDDPDIEIPGFSPELIDPKVLLKEASPVPLRQIAGAPYRAMRAAVMAALTVGAIFVVAPIIQEAMKPETPVVQQESFSPEELRAMQVQRFLKEVASRLNADGAFVDPRWAVEAKKAIEEAAFLIPGWRFGGGKCTPVQGCAYSWDAGDQGSSRLMFAALDPIDGALSYDNGAEKAVLKRLGKELWPDVIDAPSRLSEKGLSAAPSYRATLAMVADFCRGASPIGIRCAFGKRETLPDTPIDSLKGLTYQAVTLEGVGSSSLDLALDRIRRMDLHVRSLDYRPPFPITEAKWRMEVFYVAKI